MNKIKLILFDLDRTLSFGEEAEAFYGQYSVALERTLAGCLRVSQEKAKEIADYFRAKFNGRGEIAFDALGIGLEPWYAALCELNPNGYLRSLPETQKTLNHLKKKGVGLGLITDGPTASAKLILKEIGVNQSDFDLFLSWERGSRPPKGGSSRVYIETVRKFNLEPPRVLMVGDSAETDIIPAREAGLETLQVVGAKVYPTPLWPTIPSIEKLVEIID